ncbi:MAG: YggS family pyridoxal phosphate-dependent enzyme [bacterium]
MMGRRIENLEKIKTDINLEKCKIIAVSKYVGPNEIIEAYNAGIEDFGENKAQDAEQKRELLPKEVESGITWHFIGHLQTNKVKKIVGNYEIIHSVDSLKLAVAVSDEAKKRNLAQKILLQVNVSEEESKFGFNQEQFVQGFQEFINLENLNIVGLMTMAPFTEDRSIIRNVFKQLRLLRDQLESEYTVKLPELSMGMSNDYQIAYEEGATMLRLGSILFK